MRYYWQKTIENKGSELFKRTGFVVVRAGDCYAAGSAAFWSTYILSLALVLTTHVQVLHPFWPILHSFNLHTAKDKNEWIIS